MRRVAAIPEADAIGREALLPGDIVSERFEIVSLAGRGGMGAVYRAIDRENRQPVAIKVVSASDGDGDERFVREARVLSELIHPCIVRYHAQGTTRRGQLYFAMEWLEGEELAVRLGRSKLNVDESLALVRRIAEGLAIAHARGIVHRDIKPSNIFLPNREIRAGKLIDFGVARRLDEPTSLRTHTGAVLGTVGYMSPEQAMGSRDVDARTDVFALGCVLYECLTGQPAFNGVNPVAALAKVLYEDPPRAREAMPELRAGIDELLAKMLEKRPERRLRDAAGLIDALDELEHEVLAPSPRAAPISANERAMAAVVLGQLARDVAPRDPELDAIRALTAEFGAEPVALRGGGLAVVLAGAGAATDLAERAVRCALRLSQLRPELSYAVATGRTEDPRERAPTGAAIDRAAQLLAAVERRTAGVAVDALTAGLIGSSFELRSREGVMVVVAERPSVESARSLMGKPTPFLGRDKELALLEATLRECIDDSIAQAVLVTGAPGQGKSRLRQEFVRASVRSHAELRVLLVRTDPLGARSSLLLIKRLLRAALPLSEDDDYTSLSARVAELAGGENSERLAGFLGELLGTPCPGPLPNELRAARNEPQIMSVWVRRSFAEWFAAFAAKGPALIALEDLQWADSASVAYLSDALRGVHGSPLLVLAVARSEVHELFPHLFTGTALQSLALGRLTPRAAERLVQCVLGPIDATSLARVVEQADGNAFYLEELMRGVARGDSASVPESVLALVQSRLEGLAPAQRQVLRAASVFGEVCWVEGVSALLDRDLELQLRELVQLEVLSPVLTSRFAGEEEFRFRHSLIREAAYGMLPEGDRVRGHALAAEWLERIGERDAMTLANHYDLGDISDSAVRWLLRAGRAALSAGNGDDAMQCAARGLPRSVTELERGRFQTMRMEAFILRSEWSCAVEAAELATLLLPAKSDGWFYVHCGALLAGTLLGSELVITKLVNAVMAATTQLEAAKVYGHAVFMATQSLWLIDRLNEGVALVRRVEQLLERESLADPLLQMWLDSARSLIELRHGRLGIALDQVESAFAIAERLGSWSGRGMAASNLVIVLSETGHLARTLEAAQRAHAICDSVGMRVNHDHIDLCVAAASADSDEHAPGIAELRAALHTMLQKQDSEARSSLARTWLAYFELDRGDLDSAQRTAEQAFEEAHFASSRGDALAVLALVALCRGKSQLALEQVQSGLAATSTGATIQTASVLRLARARALHALERHAEAAEAIRVARDRVLDCAATLHDPELRETFLRRRAHEATLRLANSWLAEGGLASTPERRSVYG